MPAVSLNQLLAAAQAGQLISFPTDTVPALAVQPDRAHLLFAAKQRPLDKPFILMAAAAADLWPYVTGTAAEFAQWQAVADRYWPGALTLVLPASDRVPPAMNPSDPTTIGIRVPNHSIARYLLAQTAPLATTSANRSGEPALTTLGEIQTAFPEVFVATDADLAGLEQSGELDRYRNTPTSGSSGVPSTVAKWTQTGWKILRQGGVQLA